MIVPDGRTDTEKLNELLGNPEETHLDLKAKVDLDVAEDKLKFVKDAVTMSQRPPGGYVLIGVDDDGNPCMPVGTITDRKRFDGSRIQALIRGYIEGEVHVLVQIHEVDGNEIVMVYVQQNRDKLPVPFNKDGQYPGSDGKPVTVFRKGEIFVREGAENVPIRYAHWQDILSAYAEKIRGEAEATAQNLLSEVVAARQQAAGATPDVPLLMEMDETTFTSATVSLLEAGNDVRLRQFIRSLSGNVGPGVGLEGFTAALDKWTIFCAQALHFDRGDLVDEAIEKLCDAYKKLGLDEVATHKRFAVVTRIYVLGSLAVRLEAWETVRSLALQPVPSSAQDPDYVYSSWIRNATVFVARANLHEEPGQPRKTRAGFLLSAARDLMAEHPAMRPDLTDDQVPTEITNHDIALNSLCEFDIAYCFVVAALGTDHGSAYPSSAAFDEDRAKPMAQRIVASADLRQRLFPSVPDSRIAEAIADIYEIAIRESASQYGGRWWGMPPSVDAWVNENHPPA
ncbi:AlbA family DNA-binding domain-containing protein [Mycolicibacterium celeriflavum]|uniref:AlbA family DNA-binding domain-containing protein n=1 Tax=Mycolicibacterium celeriflavum TaxID=1249101 RepID=UPI003CE90968